MYQPFRHTLWWRHKETLAMLARTVRECQLFLYTTWAMILLPWEPPWQREQHLCGECFCAFLVCSFNRIQVPSSSCVEQVCLAHLNQMRNQQTHSPVLVRSFQPPANVIQLNAMSHFKETECKQPPDGMPCPPLSSTLEEDDS